MEGGVIREQDRLPLLAVAVLLGATAAWWALALWPLPTEAPDWLERARSVCFNTTGSGLPDASGWILLVGQPLGMVALLVAGWGERTRNALEHLASSASGRVVVTMTVLVVMGGVGATGARVLTASIPEPTLPEAGDVPDSYPRLDRSWPVVPGLVDQRGRVFSLASLDGRPALLTFGFAHCEAICPLLVASSLEARDRVAGIVDLRVVVLTLDPWRDTPSRLPSIAEQWGVGSEDLILSGPVDAVENALTAWNVARVRDASTGDVVHPALVYLVEADGTVAYASTGSPDQIEALARRMR